MTMCHIITEVLLLNYTYERRGKKIQVPKLTEA